MSHQNNSGVTFCDQIRQSFLDRFLTMLVESRSSLIQKDDLRPAKENSCNGKALSLSTYTAKTKGQLD